MKTILFCLLLVFSFDMQAQLYNDYIGAGHDQGIIVSSSSDANGTSSYNTINGSGLDADKMEASRLLAQAAIGADMSEIEKVVDMGIEAWIDDQISMPGGSMEQMVEDITAEIQGLWLQNGLDLEDFFGPYALHFHYAWWQYNMTNQDLLRQRVALALSEILVISINSDLIDYGVALGDYYDILSSNAFGSYKDLLMQVTTHPCMGFYLSHLNNPKTNIADNIRPDQNYAREIMQLFTIGLYELNIDGTRKLDGNGNPIPTYDNTVIEEVSKVFTGLGAGGIEPWVDWTNTPYFGLGFWGTQKNTPMVMYESEHEPGPKTIFNNLVVNANGTNSGMEDIEETIDYLMAHDNTGPFVSYRLIQRLVKSNPTPQYVARIAGVFRNSNGNLGEVVKAILMDPEARSCADLLNPNAGKLREPFIRYTHTARSFEKDSPFDRYWNNGFAFLNDTRQHVMGAPSVFNFFVPDHQPNGDIANANLVAPEFQIHNSRTSIEYINQVNQWVVWNALWWSWEGDIGDVNISLMLDDLESVSDDPEALLHELDILLTHGQLTDTTRDIIKEAIRSVNDPVQKAELALYLILISPDYNITK